MSKRRVLKLALDFNQPHWNRDVAGVRVHKADALIADHIFSHFRGKLQEKGKVKRAVFGEFIFIGSRGGQAQLGSDGAQDMPGHTVVFAVGVAIAQDE